MKDENITIREVILDDAKRIISGGRDKEYGGPEESFDVIADVWTAYLKGCGCLADDRCITAEMVGWMMVGFKMARAATAPEPKRDTFVDAAGYAACAAECALSVADDD